MRGIYLLIFVSVQLFGQEDRKLFASQDSSVVYTADTIYFYGYDFSHAIVTTKHPIDDFIFRWILNISRELPPSYFEKKMYMNVIHDFSFTNKENIRFIENKVSYTQLHEEDTVSVVNYPLLFDNITDVDEIKEPVKDIATLFSYDTMEKFIARYSLAQKSGIGLVVFVASIDKRTESTILQFVFFDIYSKKLISSFDYFHDGAGGIGMENHWQSNFTESVLMFLKDYGDDLYFDYRSEYKRKKKRMKNLRNL